ncbi:hypothetical protein OA101_03010 [Alphaproteobacteria bacterium]|nr:hypothetical protein [Alphaproteobacteria bacterium]
MYNNIKRLDLKKVKNTKTKTEKIILYHCIPTNFLKASIINGVFYPKYDGIFLADSDRGAFRGSQRKYECFNLLSIISVNADIEKLEMWKNNISNQTHSDEFYFYEVDMIPQNEWKLIVTFPS